MTDTADLRRRVYDAARTPAIRLTPTTLKLAQSGGVFHLNGTEADEITQAVMDLIEPVLTEAEELRRQLADTPTTQAAIAQLRAWVPDYDPGATHVAMPVATARKLLAALDHEED